MSKDVLDCYENAKIILNGLMTNNLVMNDAVFPHWIGGSNSFWYKRETATGYQFRLVDAYKNKNIPAFNHSVLSDLLSKKVLKKVSFENLPVEIIDIYLFPLQVVFKAFRKKWIFYTLEESLVETEFSPEDDLISPDGSKSIFRRDCNLWVRDSYTNFETALTYDGTVDYCYGGAPVDSRLQAVWSLDSKRVFMVQLDSREVTSRPIVRYAPLDGSDQVQIDEFKMSYPGDTNIETYRLYAIDISRGDVIEADYAPIPAMVIEDTGFGFFSGNPLGWWSNSGQYAYFVDLNRQGTSVRVVEFDTFTGATKILFEERSDTFISLSHSGLETPIFLPLPSSDELIWFSESSGWGHLYLYDLTSGRLKHEITQGEWLVRDIVHYDQDRRELILQTAGRDENVSPYYRDVCMVNIDSCELTTINSGPFDCVVYDRNNFAPFARSGLGVDSPNVSGVCPSGAYLVITQSRVDMAPISILINREGTIKHILEIADTSRLPNSWVWPEPVKLLSDDGKKDTYGVVFRPPDFSEEKTYPVIDFAGSMRNYALAPQGSFINEPVFGWAYFLPAALAALGFIVVAIEGRGTPMRGKAFQDYNYGEFSSASDLSDRVAGLRQLAKKYPYMDLERVGISGIDGMDNSVYGLTDYPGFYKVAVVHCYQEPRFAWGVQGEIFHDLSSVGSGGSSKRRVEDSIESLEGKLLLIEGMISPSTPSGTFQLVEALHKANKDFDMLCLPNLDKNLSSYTIRRDWDYLVKNLQGIDPPKGFKLSSGLDLLLAESDNSF